MLQVSFARTRSIFFVLLRKKPLLHSPYCIDPPMMSNSSEVMAYCRDLL